MFEIVGAMHSGVFRSTFYQIVPERIYMRKTANKSGEISGPGVPRRILSQYFSFLAISNLVPRPSSPVSYLAAFEPVAASNIALQREKRPSLKIFPRGLSGNFTRYEDLLQNRSNEDTVADVFGNFPVCLVTRGREKRKRSPPTLWESRLTRKWISMAKGVASKSGRFVVRSRSKVTDESTLQSDPKELSLFAECFETYCVFNTFQSKVYHCR